MPQGDFYVNGQYMGQARDVQMMNTTTSTGTNDLVWDTWLNTGTTISVSPTTDSVWLQWGANTGSGTYVPYTEPKRTPEQEAAYQAEQARRMEEWKAKQADRKAEQAEADRKAKVILEENLSDEQRAQMADNNWFEVVTKNGTYRIRRGWAGNVDRYHEGKPVDRYCIHPGESVPLEDNMLAQKLLLEADEDSFLRIANRSHAYAYA